MKDRHDYLYSYNRRNKYKLLFIRLVVTVIVFVLFYLLANNVYANDSHGGRPDLGAVTRGTTWLLPSDGVYIEALQLDSKVDIRVSGMIARASVGQRFKNSSSLWAEGIYVFPLPDNAAVDHFKLIVDGRIIEGQVQEKEQARNTYENAKRKGQRTGLVEQQRPNVFTTTLANIAPGAEITVEIEYQQTLEYRDGQYSLRFPLVVGERYITASTQGAGNMQYDLGVYTESSTTANDLHPTAINVQLDAGIAVSNIISSSHAISINAQSDNQYTVSLQHNQVPADRDFLLSWTPERGALPKATVFNQQQQGYQYSLVTVYPPQNEFYNQLDVPREVVFILDISGSMSGTSIEQAKSALLLALDRLKPSDKFNIIWFNDIAKKIYFDSRFASHHNLQQARGFITALNAGGGTEMLPALKLALSPPVNAEFLRQLIFITDGNINNERDLFAYIKDNLGDNRLFTVGIGSAPNSFFMKKSAQAGRGTFTFISDTREVGNKIAELFRKLETPALTNIRLSASGDDIESYHNPIPDLYLGEPVSILLRGKNIADTITLDGNIGNKPWRYQLSLRRGTENPGISVAWAREKLAALNASYHDEHDANFKYHYKLQIIETALAHHLVSSFTSLVAVDVTPVNQSGSLYQERIKNNLPYGWTRPAGNVMLASAAQIALPQTGTASYKHLLLAMLFMLLAIIIRRLRSVL